MEQGKRAGGEIGFKEGLGLLYKTMDPGSKGLRGNQRVQPVKGSLSAALPVEGVRLKPGGRLQRGAIGGKPVSAPLKGQKLVLSSLDSGAMSRNTSGHPS